MMQIKLHTKCCRVVSGYQAPLGDPINVAKKDEVRIDSSKQTNIKGWFWCISSTGHCGWVPRRFLRQKGSVGILRHDYTSIELTVFPGEMLLLHRKLCGFWWATHQDGREGWVPEQCLEIVKCDQPFKDRFN
jgi:hypothetical protein